MANYYFVASLLPELQIGHVPSLGFEELKRILRINLNKEDLRKVKTFLLMVDLDNMRSLWVGEPIDPRGNYSAEELRRALHDLAWPDGEEFPDYLSNFLLKYTSDEERAYNFPLLLSQFFHSESEEQTGFLRDFFLFERDWRLVLVGFRAKKLGRDISAELQFEDPTDPIFAQILAQKDAKIYEPPFEYKELKPIFEAYEDSPLELHKALYEYRFAMIREIAHGEMFSIDRILDYMARLMIVENWLDLDVEKGIKIVDEMIGKVE